MRILVFISALCISLLAKQYTFEDLSKIIEQTNPSIIQSRLQTALAKEELNIAKSSFYPKISLGANAEYSKKYSNISNYYINDESLVSSTGYQNSLSLKLNYELYKFGADELNIRAGEEKLRALKFKECVVLNEAKLGLLDLYHKALDGTEKLSIYNELKMINKEIYDLSKRLYDAGDIQKTIVASHAIKLVEMEDEIIALEKELENLLGEISNLSGENITKYSQILPFKDSFTPSNRQIKFEDTARAKELNAMIASKEYQYNSKKKGHYPSIYLYAKYDFYGDDRDKLMRSIDDTQRNGYRVGLSLVYNLFDGFNTQAQIQSSFIEIKLAKAELELAKREYERDMRNLNYELAQIDHKLNTTLKLTQHADDLAKMSDKLHANQEIDRLSLLQASITHKENIMKFKEANLQKIALSLRADLIAKRAQICN